MSLLSRHILRSLAAPFGWGVIALTGLLLLNTLAPMIDSLGGKGLEWNVMAQAIVLAIPALTVLTLPMAALTASLYGFGQLAADMEMVAMYANGVSVWRMARPALIGAGVVAGINFLLFDQFVPTSNARYRALLTAVGNKHPTLAFRAGELNRLGTTMPYIMRADRIDTGGVVHGVTIYVLSSAEARRVIRADSGFMRIANGRDMLMTLYHGSSMDFRPQAQGRVEYSTFASDRITLRDVTNELQQSGQLDRGDREMSSCTLLDGVTDQSWYAEDGARQREALTRRDLRRLAGLAPLAPAATQIKPPTEKHCGLYRRGEDWLQRRLLSETALATMIADSIHDADNFRRIAEERRQFEIDARTLAALHDQPQGMAMNGDVAPPPVVRDSLGNIIPPPAPVIRDSLGNIVPTPSPVIRDSLGNIVPTPPPPPPSPSPDIPISRGVGMTPNDPILAALPRGSLAGPPDRLPQLGGPAAPNDIVTSVIELEGARQEERGARQMRASYEVEFHKKYAIPLASFCFVLLGLALALKYPQGGIGLVIGGSLLIFMIFYIMIQAGEGLAKKEFIGPAVAMYGPLAIFTLLSVLAVSSANREMGSSRSGSIFGPLLDLFSFPAEHQVKPLGTLDRYVLRQWISTFLLASLGIPAVATLIHFSDKIKQLTGRHVPIHDMLLGELYFYPYQVSLLLPAGVLFATVFTLNALGRRSELTAAKAGGVSFLRLVTPMLILATLAVPVNFALQEIAAVSSTQQRILHREKPKSSLQFRSNATFISEAGWTYFASDARREVEGQDGKRYAGRMEGVMIDAPKGMWPHPVLVSDNATWSPSRQDWTLHNGSITTRDSIGNQMAVVRFASLEAKMLKDPPASLVDEQKKSEEMRYGEFRKYMDQLRRAAAAPGQLQVDFYLKLALPVACLVVALFGAPLAVTNPRAGAALGLAMALGTTLVYLTGTQIMKAVGGKDIIDPILAAWSMNILFGVLAVVLISRVRS